MCLRCIGGSSCAPASARSATAFSSPSAVGHNLDARVFRDRRTGSRHDRRDRGNRVRRVLRNRALLRDHVGRDRVRTLLCNSATCVNEQCLLVAVLIAVQLAVQQDVLIAVLLAVQIAVQLAGCNCSANSSAVLIAALIAVQLACN
jgi:hypothetical protein